MGSQGCANINIVKSKLANANDARWLAKLAVESMTENQLDMLKTFVFILLCTHRDRKVFRLC